MMTVRRPGLSLLGATLALVAMLSLFALSSWHSAVVHDDDPVHIVSVEHDHDSSKPTDSDGPVHVLAHATGQWIALGGAMPTPVLVTSFARMWSAGLYGLRAGVGPSELLRPPRG